MLCVRFDWKELAVFGPAVRVLVPLFVARGDAEALDGEVLPLGHH